MHYLYDPCTNVSTPTTYKELIGLTGLTPSAFSKAKLNGSKIKTLNCYITNGKATLKQRQSWYAEEEHEGEMWKQLPGTKRKHLVSNHGRVKKFYNVTERYLLPFRTKGEGNQFVKIEGKAIKIGALVAQLFIRKPNSDERIIRKNGIVTDDHASNLRIVTMQELGKRTGYKSKSMPVVQVDAVTGEVLNEYRSAREAGRSNYYSYQAILDMCNGVSRQSGQHVWLFSKDYEDTLCQIS